MLIEEESLNRYPPIIFNCIRKMITNITCKYIKHPARVNTKIYNKFHLLQLTDYLCRI